MTAPIQTLRRVKLAHTVAWACFVTAILAVPLCGWARRYDWAAAFALLVFGEVLILVINDWRCPLTAVAARYTDDRRDNFDIYLPEWLARHNKTIFGWLFAGGLLFTLARWAGWLG